MEQDIGTANKSFTEKEFLKVISIDNLKFKKRVFSKFKRIKILNSISVI